MLVTEEGSNFLSIKEVTIATKPQPTSSHLSKQHQQTKCEDLYTYPEAGGGGGGERKQVEQSTWQYPCKPFWGSPHPMGDLSFKLSSMTVILH